MPSETFFRLPVSKQERILAAIREEINKASYDDLSVGSIIRECGISRGSFYQYFHNKEDIFRYMIAEYRSSVIDYAKARMQENGGDLFDTVEATYRHTVRMLCYKDPRSYRQNLFCNIPLLADIWTDPAHNADIYGPLLPMIDRSRLTVTTDGEVHTLLSMCITVAVKELFGILIADDSEPVALEHFLPKLALLRAAYSRQ